MVKVKLNLDGLNKVYKALNSTHTLRVGILGDKAAVNHEGSDLTNAEIGAIQEFGSVANKIPARSFLQMPLSKELPALLNKRDVRKGFEKCLEEGNLDAFLEAVGEKSVAIVKDAFENSGYGTWAANAPITIEGGWMRNKQTGAPVYVNGKAPETKPLIHTRQLRDSITYEVVENENN